MVSPEAHAPGVYINELTRLPRPIQYRLTAPASNAQADPNSPTHEMISGPPDAVARGISLNHYFPAQENQIWISRTTGNDPAWQSVKVRQLGVRIQNSLTQGLQWAVFENNGPALWAQVSNTVGDFMQGLFQEGALQGTNPSQAYFVRCDMTTMTQNDIDSGHLVVITGFAPVHPAEFVVIQIGIWTRKKP